MNSLSRTVLFVVSVFLLTLLSCNQKKTAVTAAEKNNSGRVLNFYNWDAYIGRNTLKNFTAETGIKVNLEHYDDEEEMMATIQSLPDAYDLVVSSDDLVRELTAGKILQPVDFKKIPNMRHVDPSFISFMGEEQRKYVVPYLMGTTGMVINTKYINSKYHNSWAALFVNPPKGKTAMLNNSFEVMAAAAKYLGYSINTTDEKEFTAIKKLLLGQKSSLAAYYGPVTIMEKMVLEELYVAQVYSGEGLAAAAENPDLVYVIPKEGAAKWVDLFVIPRDAKNVQEAHEFINYILRPEVSAAISSELWYATTNKSAHPAVDKKVFENQNVYPSKEVLDKCEYFHDIGEANLILSQIWSELTYEE
jgi:spermidine/putrescine transport system substrate-binding protein